MFLYTCYQFAIYFCFLGIRYTTILIQRTVYNVIKKPLPQPALSVYKILARRKLFHGTRASVNDFAGILLPYASAIDILLDEHWSLYTVRTKHYLSINERLMDVSLTCIGVGDGGLLCADADSSHTTHCYRSVHICNRRALVDHWTTACRSSVFLLSPV